MKLKILNSKPCHVIQIFVNSYRFDKDPKMHAKRKVQRSWPDQILSPHFVGKEIYLSKNKYEIKLAKQKWKANEEPDPILFIQDSKQGDSSALFTLSDERPTSFGSFDFYIKDEIIIYFQGLGHIRPKRNFFKLAELNQENCIEVQYDGVIGGDFNSRNFFESTVIIQYKGIIPEIFLLREEKNYAKSIPKPDKVINLKKYLR